MKLIISTILILSFFTVSCMSSESYIHTAIAQTLTSEPTLTSTPTSTSTPTETPTPTSTNTSTATITSTFTSTPEFTLTPTPIPPALLTQMAFNKTQKAVDSMGSYESIPNNEFITYPENYKGRKIRIRGEVFNVSGNILQVWVEGGYDSAIIFLRSQASGVYDNDKVVVYGIVKGKYCFTNVLNAQICDPALEDAFFTIGW